MTEHVHLTDDLEVVSSICSFPLPGDTDAIPEDFPTEASALDILRGCIDDCYLTSRELKAMRLRLGLDGQSPMSRCQVAAEMGTSIARIRQIEAKMIRHSPLNPYPRRKRRLLDAFD